MLACALAGGCGRSAEAEPEKTPPAPVKWEPARLVLLEEWTDLLGVTQPLPDHAARITAPVEGRVLTMLQGVDGKPLAEGQHVEAGTVIVRLDDRVVQANRDKAVDTQKALAEDVAQAKSAVTSARIDVERLHALQQRERTSGSGATIVSPVEVHKADLTLDDSESKLRAAQARLDAGAREIEGLNLQLRLNALAAPIKGRLGRIQVVPGQTLSVGASVADVVDVEDEIDVLCFVAPSAARRLQVGQAARLGTPPAGADPEGKVVYIADQAEPETGGFAVKVRFPNREARLRANVALSIRVLTQPGKECLAIPDSALMEDQDPPGVLIVEGVKTEKNAEGKEEQLGTARRVQAIVGVRDRVLHQIEILRLEDKEKKWTGGVADALFVVERGQGLQTGDPVKLAEEEPD